LQKGEHQLQRLLMVMSEPEQALEVVNMSGYQAA